MKISVLMSVYYKEDPEYFYDALKSVVNQTLKPDEIVLVKDGALTMELEKVIDEYQSRHPGLFKIHPLEKNMGLGIALREGVKVCSNQLIARMDTDDICIYERFDKQVCKFKEDPDLDLLGTYAEEFLGSPKNVMGFRLLPTDDESIREYSKRRNPFNHMTVMFKKNAVLEAGNYSLSLWNEDYHLWARMLMNGAKAANIPEHLVLVRAGKDMFKRRGGIRYAISDLRLQKEFLDMGFIGKGRFLINCFERIVVRIMPNNLRSEVYAKFLRKKNR